MGAGDAHLRRISCAGKIIATAFSLLATWSLHGRIRPIFRR
jgi:hypothetical protein